MSKFPRRRGFTLIELLIVIVVIAILALIVIPKLMGASRKAKDSTLKANLVLIRSALETYQSDCGGYPSTLGGLTVAGTYYPTGSGTAVALPANVWKGPYLSAQGGIGGGSIPRNPYVTTATESDHWTYTGTAGLITFPTPTGNDASDPAQAYSTY